VCDMAAIKKRRSELELRLKQLTSQLKEMHELSHDPDPTACVSCSEIEAQIKIIETCLMELDDAERALREGKGRNTCEDCEKPIPEERRKAMPTTTRCAKCQDRRDQNQKKRIIPQKEPHSGSSHRKPEVSPAYGCSI